MLKSYCEIIYLMYNPWRTRISIVIIMLTGMLTRTMTIFSLNHEHAFEAYELGHVRSGKYFSLWKGISCSLRAVVSYFRLKHHVGFQVYNCRQSNADSRSLDGKITRERVARPRREGRKDRKINANFWVNQNSLDIFWSWDMRDNVWTTLMFTANPGPRFG